MLISESVTSIIGKSLVAAKRRGPLEMDAREPHTNRENKLNYKLSLIDLHSSVLVSSVYIYVFVFTFIGMRVLERTFGFYFT